MRDRGEGGAAAASDRRRSTARLVGALLAALSLIVHLALLFELDRIDAFWRRNLLFDADTPTRLEALTEGKAMGIKHPNLMAYFTPPIRLAAEVITAVVPSAGPEARVRRALGLLVAPVASALTAACVFSLFCGLEFSLVQATMATLLAIVSFSALIFGSIPESYSLSALALAAAFDFAARSKGELSAREIGLWLVIGVFATGITVTNIVSIAFILWAAAWRRSPGIVATLRAAVVAVIIFGVTGVSAMVLDRLLVPPSERGATKSAEVTEIADARVVDPSIQQLRRYTVADPGRRFLHFPTDVINAFTPRAPEMICLTGKLTEPAWGYSLEHSPSVFTPSNPLGLSLFLLLSAGAVCALADEAMRASALAALGVLGFCFVMSPWGTESYLYSQNWNLAGLILLAGVMRPRRTASWMTIVFATLVAAVALANVGLVREILAGLARRHP